MEECAICIHAPVTYIPESPAEAVEQGLIWPLAPLIQVEKLPNKTVVQQLLGR